MERDSLSWPSLGEPAETSSSRPRHYWGQSSSCFCISFIGQGVPPGLFSTSTFLSSFRRSIWLSPGVMKTFVTWVDDTLELSFKGTCCRLETVTSGFWALVIEQVLHQKSVFSLISVCRSLTVICMGPFFQWSSLKCFSGAGFSEQQRCCGWSSAPFTALAPQSSWETIHRDANVELKKRNTGRKWKPKGGEIYRCKDIFPPTGS